jgi:hypothetical protein
MRGALTAGAAYGVSAVSPYVTGALAASGAWLAGRRGLTVADQIESTECRVLITAQPRKGALAVCCGRGFDGACP